MRILRVLTRVFIPVIVLAVGLGTMLYPAYTENSYQTFQDKLKNAAEAERTRETGQSMSMPVIPGEAVARLEIPNIGLDVYVMSGVGGAVLKQAPGHYEETPLPEGQGNSAIAGHRTMHGHPFLELDELTVGDQIIASTRNGRFVYRVVEVKLVEPEDVSVLDQTETPSLTLTTCDPVGSDAQRLIVVAEYDQEA